MKTNILQKTILGIGCISAIGFTACVDDSYDLNNVDMTVTVGGNLTLPASNTDVITLKKIFDLDDNSIIQADENGNYSLIKSGNPTHRPSRYLQSTLTEVTFRLKRPIAG